MHQRTIYRPLVVSFGTSLKPQRLSQLSVKIRTLLPYDVKDYCLQVQSFYHIFLQCSGGLQHNSFGFVHHGDMRAYMRSELKLFLSIDAENWCVLCRQTCDRRKSWAWGSRSRGASSSGRTCTRFQLEASSSVAHLFQTSRSEIMTKKLKFSLK